MRILKMKLLLLAIGLSCTAVNTWAQINSPNLNPNSINNDHVIVTMSFPTPVPGDLYIATQVGGNFYFFSPGAPISPTPVAFEKNGQFSAETTVLDFPSDGIPAGTYPVYQVVAKTGSDVMQVSNWVGGLAGLSRIDFNINLNNTAPVVATPTPVVVTPAPVVQPVTTPVASTLDGKALYKDKGCSASACHKADPKSNIKKILNGRDVNAIKNAIKKEADMKYLADSTDLQFANDAELQAIADYLKSL